MAGTSTAEGARRTAGPRSSRRQSKGSLRFAEGLDHQISVVNRRAYRVRDEENLRLKIVTCISPDD